MVNALSDVERAEVDCMLRYIEIISRRTGVVFAVEFSIRPFSWTVIATETSSFPITLVLGFGRLVRTAKGCLVAHFNLG